MAKKRATKKSSGKPSQSSTANLGFEATMWAAADWQARESSKAAVRLMLRKTAAKLGLADGVDDVVRGRVMGWLQKELADEGVKSGS